MSNIAKECPWCQRWWEKDDACNWVCCGLINDCGQNGFHIGLGCGNTWCWQCEKKLCGPYIDSITGMKIGRDSHDQHCCTSMPGYRSEDYCCGGHNSHK